MSTILYFKMSEVAPLFEHSLKSTERRGTFSQTHNEDFEPIENPIIPPGLIWAKDDGVYLLSNGKIEGEGTPISTGLISYAVGYDPRTNPDCWDDSRQAVGGDDFAEFFELSNEVKAVLLQVEDTGYFFLKVDQETFTAGWCREME